MLLDELIDTTLLMLELPPQVLQAPLQVPAVYPAAIISLDSKEVLVTFVQFA